MAEGTRTHHDPAPPGPPEEIPLAWDLTTCVLDFVRDRATPIAEWVTWTGGDPELVVLVVAETLLKRLMLAMEADLADEALIGLPLDLRGVDDFQGHGGLPTVARRRPYGRVPAAAQQVAEHPRSDPSSRLSGHSLTTSSFVLVMVQAA